VRPRSADAFSGFEERVRGVPGWFMSSQMPDGHASASRAGNAVDRVTEPVRWGAGSPFADNDAGGAADGLPPITWDQLEAVMTAMAASPDRRLMVHHLLQGARRNAASAPVEETVREILCIAAALGGAEPPLPPAA
jgi:hypothetical protein